MIDWMQDANKYGVWGMINSVVLVSTWLFAGFLYFFPKKRERNLNIRISAKHDQTVPDYPLRIEFDIANRTTRACVLRFPMVLLSTLRPHPNAGANSSTGHLELKFPPSPGQPNLGKIEILLRHEDNVVTWVPLDPTHSDDEVDTALTANTVGTFECECNWVGDKLKRSTLRFPIRRR